MTQDQKVYKVGETTDYGRLLAESVSWEYPDQIISMYHDADENEYSVYVWAKDDGGVEYQADCHSSDNQEDSTVIFLQLAFNVSL